MPKKRATHISKDDLYQFTVTSLHTQLAQAKSETAELRRHIANLVHQLDVYKLQELHERKIKEADSMATFADGERDSAYKEHRNLAASFADRYNFDTKTSAIDPMTGKIVPLPNAEEYTCQRVPDAF